MHFKDSNGSIIAESYGEIALLTILNVLQMPPRKDVVRIEHCKLINLCLKSIQDILPSVRTLLKRHLGQLLLTIKNYIFYGFPGYEVPFPNIVASGTTSSKESSSDMEPDDLSLLKVSLNPVKERAFPARGALKKKSRQKRGRRQKNGKQTEDFDTDQNFSPGRSRAGKGAEHAGNSRGRHETKDAAGHDTSTVSSWRDRAPEQNWRLDDSMNAKWVNPTSSSESEFSDSETGQVRRLRSAKTRVRNTSLVCLQYVIKNSDRKDLFGFWSSFISDDSEALQWSLFTIIQNDDNIKNRIGAISVLMDLLDGSKPFLAAADDNVVHQSSSSRSFTPFSFRLGFMIHELHRLLDCIPTESSNVVQCQLVKCLALLVLNCPYHKLQHGLLSRIVATIRPLLRENDTSLKQACLVCLSAVLTVNAPLAEVVETMQETRTFPVQEHFFESSKHSVKTSEPSPPMPDDAPTTTDSESSFPWLIYECFNILQSEDASSLEETVSVDAVSTTRSEAVLLLIVFVRNYFHLLSPVVRQISLVARECLQHSSSTIKVNAMKLLQELSRVMYQEFSPSFAEDGAAVGRDFWLKLLEGNIVKILQSKDPLESKIRSAACDCLSDIGAGIFERLTFDKKVLIVTLLIGLVNDEDAYVRAASIRCLGVFVLYPVLREDTVFVTDTANAALNGLNDSVLLVRMRAAWTLANLSDALVINKNIDESTFVYEFSENLLLRLINASLKASEDSEKVRCNIVRTLGNLAKYLSKENVEKQVFLAAVEKKFEVLSKCILNGQMKTRWNACYAAGNVYSNLSLPNGQTSASIQMQDALLFVVNSCKNFKVRINAVNALAVPSLRGCYGDEIQFAKVWRCLVETLSITKDISDFSEFKYRDNLREQICKTICHLVSLTEVGDLQHILPAIQLYQDDLTEQLTNFYQKQLKQNEVSNVLDDETTEQKSTNEFFLLAFKHIMAMPGEARIIQNIYIEAKSCAENALTDELTI
ncbi:HEAT repeat-containing protein 6-like isoform X2 [Dendronephthya gigantea]|uniref:HEAT repeat-containing protein 6-like isoform X2 n=1 Tax=Dendronephthya gigantea TaxID=151771 RepID=UPI0010696966|nr:HEAT repeat-containing protein 6-like isoform X2 [Dendronephthya gigantea]